MSLQEDRAKSGAQQKQEHFGQMAKRLRIAPSCIECRNWPYWPQVLVFIGILVVAGIWCWWSESGDWVVRVNGAPISRAEWQQETSRALSSLPGFNPNAPGNEKIDEQISKEVLQQLVDRMLMRQAAARAGISASPGDVEARVIMDMMNNGGQDNLEQALESQGYTLDQYRRLVAEMITISKLNEYVTRNVTVTEDEVRAAYESERDLIPRQLSFADVHDQLQQQVLAHKKNDVFIAYINGLRENSFIENRASSRLEVLGVENNE